MKKTIYYLSLVALGFGCLVLFAFIQVIIEDAFPEITKSIFLWNWIRIIIFGGIIYLFKVLKKEIRKIFKFEDDNN